MGKKFEVGISSNQHIWRKRVLSLRSFEQLVHQIRFLDSYLNKSVINSLDGLSRRMAYSKGSIQRVMKCSHRSCGVTEYFIVNQGKWRGCWQSEGAVELSALALDRSNRIQGRKARIAMEVERKRKEEAER